MRVQSHIRKYRASAFCQKSIKLSTFASISLPAAKKSSRAPQKSCARGAGGVAREVRWLPRRVRPRRSRRGGRGFSFFVFFRHSAFTPRRVVDATRVSFAALSQNVTCKSGRRTPAIGARFERGPHLRDAPLRGLEVRHADEPRKEQRQFVFRKDAARAARSSRDDRYIRTTRGGTPPRGGTEGCFPG